MTLGRTHAQEGPREPKFTATLQELRQQRGLLDQAITALEMINGERPLPEITQLVEPARSPKLLAAARRMKRKYTRRAVATTPAPSPSPAPKARVAAQSGNGDDIVSIVRDAGGSITPRVLMTKLKLKDLASVRHRTAPLLKNRQLIALGATLNRRLALPGSAKEAP